MNRYYYLSSGAKLLLEPTEEWQAEYRQRFPCLHRPTEDPIDIMIKGPLEDIPLNFVRYALISVIRSDLLKTLNPEASEHLLFGRVFDRSLRLLPDLKTIGSRSRYFLRGGPKSSQCFCPNCGMFLYHPLGSWYLLERDIDGRPIYSGRYLLGLVIGDEIYARVRKKRWKKLFVSRLKIASEPLDGLPADLSKVKPADLAAHENQRCQDRMGGS